jgi:ABC-2 type transport system permease protein
VLPVRELSRVFANEWMKLLRRRRFLVTGLLSLCVVALFGLVTYHKLQNQLRFNPVQQTQTQIQFLEQRVAKLKLQPKSADRDKELQQMEQQLASAKEELKSLQSATGSNWRDHVQTQMKSYQQRLNQLSAQADKDAQAQAEMNSIQRELKLLQYRLDHNVPELAWPDMNAYHEVAGFLGFAARIFLPLLVIVLVADIVSGEATDGTIKLLLVRPVSRTKILVGKWLVSVTATLLWSLLVSGALLLTAFAILGTRGALQPQAANVVYTFESAVVNDGMVGPHEITVPVPHYDHALIMPQWQFLLYGFLFTAFAMVVVATIAFFCSTLFRSAMVSTAAAMGSVIIGFIVINMARHENWVQWLFPTHLDLVSIWTGELSQQMSQAISLPTGVLVLLAWALVALVVSLYSFARRDILNA